jgi:uncharacterized membrane protein
MPVAKMIYSSIKDLVNAFVGEKKQFNQPVLVSLSPDGAVRVMGFVTRENMAVIGLEGDVAVYIPQSYNFAGNLIIVPAEQVTLLAVESGKAMAFIVSGGVSAL